MTKNPHQPKLAALRHSVLSGPGHLPAEVRQAAAEVAPTAGFLTQAQAQFAAQVHAQALRVTDAQVDALRATHSEDQIFELTVAAATGAGLRRLDRVLALLAPQRHP